MAIKWSSFWCKEMLYYCIHFADPSSWAAPLSSSHLIFPLITIHKFHNDQTPYYHPSNPLWLFCFLSAAVFGNVSSPPTLIDISQIQFQLGSSPPHHHHLHQRYIYLYSSAH